MAPIDKGLVLGVLGGAVLSLLMWQLSWIAVGAIFGVGIGYLVGRRRTREKADGHAPPRNEQFLTEFRAGQGQKPVSAGRTLQEEARSVPDPGGPLLGAYYDALKAWADTHPEVDRAELDRIIDRLLWEHR